MGIFFNVIVLVVGFGLLIKGADYFVEGSSSLADRLGIPQIIIGLTIVAFGTSAPEAAISISAAIKGNTGIAIGNIIGSNIMNILLILGITSCIVTLNVAKSTAQIEIPFVIAITALLVLIGGLFGELGFVVGCVFWVLLIVFCIYLIQSARKKKVMEEEVSIKKEPVWKMLVFILFGLLAIVLGSDFTVDSASYIASAFGMSDRIIGLTIVAFGTSLPELITSVTAGIRGKADIAIGNIVGSNIFNILFILGTTCLIKSVPYNTNFIVDGIICILAAIILFLGVIRKRQLKRPVGIIMLVCYIGYFIYLCVA